MAATAKPLSGFSDLNTVTCKIYYKSTVSYLPESMGGAIMAFKNDPLSQQFYKDTGYCVTKQKTFNVKCLYDTFAELCELDADSAKDLLIKEIHENKAWFIKLCTACLGMRMVTFEAWYKKLQKPRTWPNEFALYALCVVFRRNAIVINAGQPWTSMQLPEGMTFDTCLEMCKTRLLYIGNNLYAILRRQPFSLYRPLEVNIKEIQKSRQLMWDRVEGTLRLEMQIDSTYKSVVADDEIYELPEQKPEFLPDVQTKSILDPDYVPDFLPDVSLIKSEPVDTSGTLNYTVIGHIIDKLASVSKAIKQELIDKTAQALVEQHSSQCAITHFVHEKQSDTGLCIEDVRSLLVAEDAS